jgi:hypothetical protein
MNIEPQNDEGFQFIIRYSLFNILRFNIRFISNLNLKELNAIA